jgi:periplasmic protein TonB
MSDTEQKEGSRYLGIIGWAVGFALLIALAYFVGKTLLGKSGPAKPTLKQITMVRIHTPPPPPPKPPEKPPEPPPPQKQEVKMDEPKPQEAPKPAEEPPAQAKLGVDAEASGEGDSFGLGANKGGRDLVASGVPNPGAGTGTGTGTGSAVIARSPTTGPTNRIQYTFYRDVMVRHLNDLLAKVPELKDQDASIPVAIWVDRSGRIEKIDVSGGNLSAERVELLRNALLNGPNLRQLPPENMPQPLRVRIKVQDAG